MMLKGMTVQYLIRRTYRVQAGETVLWSMPQPAASASSPASGSRRSASP